MSASSSPNQNRNITTMSASSPPTPTPTPTQRRDGHLVIDIPPSGVHPAFTVNNIRNSIPIVLNLGEFDQYESWVELFRIHAYAYNVLDHIDPNTPRPSTLDQVTWERLDAIFKQWIFRTISKELLQTIMIPGASANELWARLKEIFEKRKVMYVEELVIEFQTRRLEHFFDMYGYCERLEELSIQLTKSGHHISESKLVDQLMSGLPNGAYEATATMIQQADPDLPSFKEVRSYLLWEEGKQYTPQQLTVTVLSQPDQQLLQLYLKVYKAALSDDWNCVSEIFENNQELMSEPITPRFETPLMIAVGTNRSHNFVQRLLEMLESEDLYAQNQEGNTALHYAAKVGNMIDAKRLVAYNDRLTIIENEQGKKAVMLAASLGRKEMLLYLLGVTSFSVDDLENLIPLVIQAGFTDVALPFIHQEHHRLGMLVYRDALTVLATKPELFLSPNSLGFWGHLLYSLVHVNKRKLINERLTRSDDGGCFHLQRRSVIATGFKRVLEYIAPTIKSIYDIKVKHVQTSQIVKHICHDITIQANPAIAWEILESTIATAIKHGACDLVEECISAYPCNLEETSLFHLAIQERQEKVYNLISHTTRNKAFVATYVDERKRENALHIAAMLPTPDRLNVITGEALQLQYEFHWFKEVESFVGPLYSKALNVDRKTPRMIFIQEHKELLRKGEAWMKETASSCSVVAALIVTITFAAVITVPGGNKDDDGKPMFLNNGAFMIFIILDAFGLFSSSTSLLMFLGIFYSRYAEGDFLYVLPKRMMFGLVFLFFSLAATLVSFSAAVALVLQDKVAWIVAPLFIITCIPRMFVWLPTTPFARGASEVDI